MPTFPNKAAFMGALADIPFFARNSGIQPGQEVVLVRGSRGRGPESGPGFEREVRARYLGGDEVNIFCELLEDDPHGGAPNRTGEVGCWHGESFIRQLP